MNTIDVRLNNKQLEFVKKCAGKRSVTNELTEMVQNMIDGMIWMEEHKEEVENNGKTVSD